MKRKSLKAGAIALTLGAFMTAAPMAAQVGTNYNFTATPGTYTPITGGTVIQAQTETGFSSAGGMDDFIYNLPAGTIPFTFSYDGVGYTGCNVSSNGFITFGATAPAGNSYVPISAATAYSGAVSGWGRDARGGFTFTATRAIGSAVLTGVSSFHGVEVGKLIWVGSGGTAAAPAGIPAGTTVVSFDTGLGTITMSAAATTAGTAVDHTCLSGELRHETLGSSPNRVFVIQYKNFRRFGTPNTNISANFQIRLYEADNAVEVQYGNCNSTASDATSQVGLRGPNNTFPANVNNRLVASGGNWASSSAGTSNSSVCSFVNTTRPASGQVYRWFDPPCATPAANISTVFNCTAGTYVTTVNVTGIGDALDVDVVSSVHGIIADNVGIGSYAAPSTPIATSQTFTVVHNGNALCNITAGTGPGASPCFDNGVCYTPGLASPDNNCPAGVTGIVAISGQPTVLGTNVFVESVDIILTGTFRGDNDIRLINPNGTSVLLIDNRGGSGDNFGDFATCPAGAMKLKDGATALSTILATPLTVTGTFAPEVPLTTFNDGSNPNGNWQVVVCDNATGDVQSLRHIEINFVTCLSPSATATTVPNCVIAGPDTYTIDVNVTALGSATDVDITSSINGLEEDNVGVGLYSVGPFPAGTPVTITVVHNGDNACNLTFGPLNVTCPPDNDLCANAIAVGCNSVTVGTTTGSTVDAVGTCTTTLNTAGGVWYTFVGTGGNAKLALCGSTYDTKMGVFTTPDCSTFTCVEGNDDDTDANGLNECSNDLHSSMEFITTAGTTYYVLVTGFLTNTGNFTLELTCGGNDVPPCADNGVVVDLTTDDFGSETSWEIVPVGNSLPVCSGSGYPNNASVSVDCCLLDGCYTLAFFDSFGDGMCCANGVGGYKLSTSNGKRIIDNVDDGEFTSVSSVANGFCLPIGNIQLTIATCDKEDFLINDVVVSGIDPAVSAQFGVTDATSGYQFWLFDPDGSYSRRLFRSHASGTCVGTPAGATRAAHMKFSCLNSVLPNVPTDLLLNMRVRPRVAGTYGEFGPACRVMVLSAPPACPTTQLDNNPLHAGTTLSCGATGKVVAASGYAGKLYPNIVAGANKYQYEFVQAGEGYIRTIATATGSYALTLANWATNPLLCGTYTYDVRVRVSFDGGANWCPYGPVCTVEITNNPPNNCTPVGAFQAGGLNTTIAAEEGLSMWPNPTGDGRVTIELNGLSAEAMTANIEVFDLFGKRVASEAISTDGATELNKVMTLDNLATGMYMVHVTSGNKQFTERLVIK